MPRSVSRPSAVRPLLRVGSAALVCLLLCGCLGSGNKKTVAQCEADFLKLQETQRQQFAELEELRSRSRRLEEALAVAERRLTEAAARPPQVVSRDANPDNAAEPAVSPARKARAPKLKLADWAGRQEEAIYDDGSKIARWKASVLFETGRAELTAEGLATVKELARLINDPAADRLNLMLVGHTDGPSELLPVAGKPSAYRDEWQLSAARSVAVADALRKAGVAGRRLGIAAFGDHQPLVSRSAPEERRKNQRVELFFLDEETPLVGRLDSITPLY